VADYSISLGDAIQNAAAQYGVSASYLTATHAIEGNGTSTAGAQGPFQFIPSTALSMGITDPFDPQQSANGAAQLAQQNYQYLSQQLGRAPADWELYLAHQQGPAGAVSLLTADPGASATQVRGSVAAITGNGGTASMSAGDFVSHWQDVYAQKSGGVMTGAVSSPSSAAVGGGGGGGSGVSWLDSLLGNETQGQRDSYNAKRDAGQPTATGIGFFNTATWAHWGTRIGVFITGVVFVGAGLVMFGLVSKQSVMVIAAPTPLAGRVARRASAEMA
jgi:hypothetical protein